MAPRGLGRKFSDYLQANFLDDVPGTYIYVYIFHDSQIFRRSAVDKLPERKWQSVVSSYRCA